MTTKLLVSSNIRIDVLAVLVPQGSILINMCTLSKIVCSDCNTVLAHYTKFCKLCENGAPRVIEIRDVIENGKLMKVAIIL